MWTTAVMKVDRFAVNSNIDEPQLCRIDFQPLHVTGNSVH